MTLCAGPDTVEHFNSVSLLVEVTVPVAGEVPCATRHGKGTCNVLPWILGSANVCLVITNAQVFRPEFCPSCQTHAGLMPQIDHLLIKSFRVHIDFNRTTRAADRFEEGFPEVITSLRDAALTVDAKSYAGDFRTKLQQLGQSVTAIRSVGRRCEAPNAMVGIWTRCPLIC